MIQKHRVYSYLIAVLISSFLFACDLLTDECPGTEFPADTENQVTITQGIWGNVWFWEGDFQPLCPSGKVTPVVREIYVHKGTPVDSVDHNEDGPFLTNIKTELIAVVRSNSTGFFQVALDTGAYSFFIKEDSLYYAGGGDRNFLQPGYVNENSVSKVQLDITYNAAY